MLDKILSFLASKLTTKVGTFQFASGVTGDISSARIAQVGNVVSLQLNISVNQDPGTGGFAVGKISGVENPKQHVRAIFLSGDRLYDQGETCYAILNTAGLLTITCKTGTHRAFRGNITYVV